MYIHFRRYPDEFFLPGFCFCMFCNLSESWVRNISALASVYVITFPSRRVYEGYIGEKDPKHKWAYSSIRSISSALQFFY